MRGDTLRRLPADASRGSPSIVRHRAVVNPVHARRRRPDSSIPREQDDIRWRAWRLTEWSS